MERIAAKYVYTLEGKDPIVEGYVAFDDTGCIRSVGPCTDYASEAVRYDGALVPGFVNAHCHVELSYMKGLFRKGTGMAGFIDQINALRDTCPQEEKVAGIARWMQTLWDRGVSAMADISNCADSFAVKAASPLYTRTFLEVFGTEPQDVPAVMEGAFRLQDSARALGLDAAPTPHACYTMSPELLTASSAAALSAGFLSYHSEESEEEEMMLRYGNGPMYENRVKAGMRTPPVTGDSSLMYFLDRLEKVHPAPYDEHVLLVHEVCMDRPGMEAVKARFRHAFVALCPLSNIFIHRALPPVREMRSAGMRLCLGTDSLSSNDDLDMVREMFCLQENFPDIPFAEILDWACLGGAEFLSKEDELGTLSPGKHPGIVLIDHLDRDGRLTTASTSRRLVASAVRRDRP